MKERVRAAFAEMSRGNPGSLVDLLAPDADYTIIGTTALSGTLRGRDQIVARLFTPLAAALATPLSLDVESITAEGDRILVQARGRARLVSGAPYDNVYCFAFRVAGERIAAVTEYLDTALVGRAFGVPADRDRLLRLVDLNTWEMYREIARVARGSIVLETPEATLVSRPHGTPWHNMVMVRAPLDVDALLETIRGFYGDGRPFSIWTRSHADGALEAALRARGFTELVAMPDMVLRGDPGIRCEPPGLAIRPVRTDGDRRDFIAVATRAYATYGVAPALCEDGFATLESLCAPHVQGFVGRVDGRPVAAAAVYLTHGVAGINWVGTVPEQGRRRYGEAVAWAAVREGFRRGAAFASLQPTAMGRPVYERMGFETVAAYPVLVKGQG
jgi:ketosteroid isomerase-like protein